MKSLSLLAAIILTGPAIASAQPEITLISEIQSRDSVSPMVGQQVTIEGIVTATFFDRPEREGLDGFFMQEEEEDFVDETHRSQGIFIYAPKADTVQPGHVVRVTGEVFEYVTSDGASSLTELTRISEIERIDSTELPGPTFGILYLSGKYEIREGMLTVHPGRLLAENRNLGRFGELGFRLGRTRQPTDIVAPAEAGNLIEKTRTESHPIVVDDGSTSTWPTRPGFGNLTTWTEQVMLRRGSRMAGVGVIDDRFGHHRLYLIDDSVELMPDPRPLTPGSVGSERDGIPVTRIATFNIGNFFLSLDDGSDDCGPNRSLGCRGARTQQEFARQGPKILAAIRGIDPHILGVVEIENTSGVDPLAWIVDSLNASVGRPIYDYIRTGTIGTDAIRVGLLYRSDIVKPDGEYAILDSRVDPRFLGVNRPSLAQTFRRVDYDGVATVVVNHFKSKGSDCELYGDTAKGDGQGNCNGVRTAAAEALKRWVSMRPTGSRDPDIILLGDFNAYTMEDPIRVFTHGEDEMPEGANDYRHASQWDASDLWSFSTYVFDGLDGALDHVLFSPSLLWQVSGATVWHINADEPTILDYRTEPKPAEQQALWRPDPFRSSDHDPVIVGVRLTESTVGVEVEGEMPEVMDLADKE